MENPLPLTTLDLHWLDYAQEIVACDAEHLAACRDSRKSWFPQCGLNDTVRWPGNLGSRYELAELRILCLAQIHNDAHLASSMGDFEKVLVGFRDGRIAPEAFLRKCQAKYEATISGWGPWFRFLSVFETDETVFEVDESVLEVNESVFEVPTPRIAPSDVVYANVAKCWSPGPLKEDPRPRKNDYKTMATCNNRFPVESLVDMIKPELVVQVGACPALHPADFRAAARVVIDNDNRERGKGKLAEARRLIREHFAGRFEDGVL